MFTQFFQAFRRQNWCDDEGAVTVDWVVLTAFTVTLGFTVGYAVWGPAGERAEYISSEILSDVNSLLECGETSCSE